MRTDQGPAIEDFKDWQQQIMRVFPPLPLDSPWVEQTLSGMSLAQKIGQLLHPALKPSASINRRRDALGDVQPGGLFLFSGTRDEFLETTRWFQAQSSVPMIISSDLEYGAGRMIDGATLFPDPMALAAAGSEELAYEMGRATAVEGRALGVHWAFAPVVDVNINPFSPGTGNRSLGDDPRLIAHLAQATIRGLQENGLAASVKHFPGGGTDDRDQHICNTINPLPIDQWFAVSGFPFQQAIDQGVWSVMVGHISLPAWDAGDGSHIQIAPPASISKRIITGLLRERMGFQGVIITDAMDMGGVTAFGHQGEIVPAAIEAGCDMLLFSNAKEDFDALWKAVEDGRLSEARITESARRILALKEVLELNKRSESPPPSAEESAHFNQISRRIAEKAVTLVRDRHNSIPLSFEPGSRVLSYHLRGDPEQDVDLFDDLLRGRGVIVDRFEETNVGALHKRTDFDEYDALILSAVFSSSWGTNRIRPAGNYMRDIWALINAHHPRRVLVSYGSPYLIYEAPHMPCVINAYSANDDLQRAVFDVLTGDLAPVGQSPVDLEAPYFTKSMEGLRYL